MGEDKLAHYSNFPDLLAKEHIEDHVFEKIWLLLGSRKIVKSIKPFPASFEFVIVT